MYEMSSTGDPVPNEKLKPVVLHRQVSSDMMRVNRVKTQHEHCYPAHTLTESVCNNNYNYKEL